MFFEETNLKGLRGNTFTHMVRVKETQIKYLLDAGDVAYVNASGSLEASLKPVDGIFVLTNLQEEEPLLKIRYVFTRPGEVGLAQENKREAAEWFPQEDIHLMARVLLVDRLSLFSPEAEQAAINS